MDHAMWYDHVTDCLMMRVRDTEGYENIEERGLPGAYCDIVYDELHDDVRLTTLDEMIAMDMRNGSLGEYRYSGVRKVFKECMVDTTSWCDDYCMERYRLMMARTIYQLCELECVIRGYGAYDTRKLTVKYV